MESVWLAQGARVQGLCWPPFSAHPGKSNLTLAHAIAKAIAAGFPSRGSVAMFSHAPIRELSAQIQVQATARSS